ncbi:hypothetical protein [Streptomyces sp. AS02]|uniref:hypothetical protein n=1 Tax=Streptomyces sp. AS02 TaxID=2938946 RepID=UPI00201FEA2A|nr:hypothetical protein [Streptomyces sp. AS02]MCL8014940.1 hypothetical protein [Streptomyces sp. AS02]
MTWSRHHTLVTTATPEQLWARWTTAEYWASDDPAVEWAAFDAPAATGVTGRVKNTGSPAQKFRFTDVRTHERMDFEIRLPFASLSVTHAMEVTGPGVASTHGIVIEGPLSGFYGAVLGARLAAGLPDVVRRVVDGALTL